MNLRILIVDDSELTRRIIRAIVQSREWTVCAEAENGTDGIRLFQELKPDIAVIDLALPDINGLKVARRMATADPGVPLILFTVLDVAGLDKVAREAGICCTVSKAQAWDLVKCIEAAVGGYDPGARDAMRAT